jgi:uncharacterized protein YlxW (UPF0749 family)
MRRWRNRLSITAVTFVLGLLLVVQLRVQQGTTGLGGLSTQELTQLVANLSTRNDQLRVEVSTLDRELSSLTTNQSRGSDSVDQLRTDLARLRAWAGLEPVYGPGVTITVSGPLDGPSTEDLLNELRNAGAEAIAIGESRVVPGVVAIGATGEVMVDGVALDDPFEIRAIGSPETLTGSLTRVGGVIAVLGATHPEALVTVTPVERMELPATTRSLTPDHGHPRL